MTEAPHKHDRTILVKHAFVVALSPARDQLDQHEDREPVASYLVETLNGCRCAPIASADNPPTTGSPKPLVR